MTPRLPTHVEVSGLLRAVAAEGGFGTVLAKGEKDAGALLVVCVAGSEPARLFERMPQMDGSRSFVLTRTQSAENKGEFEDYLRRRRLQDEDAWIVELDIVEAERFIETAGT